MRGEGRSATVERCGGGGERVTVDGQQGLVARVARGECREAVEVGMQGLDPLLDPSFLSRGASPVAFVAAACPDTAGKIR